MIKDILSNSFTGRGQNNNSSALLISLMSRAGDPNKNNNRLKFALHGISYPAEYNEKM